MFALEDECRLAFCVGVGGVGKTTFAAALGLTEALRGRSVLVLTADPARRLADALGIRGLQDVPSNVSIPRNCGGELHAAMLETKASADAIIRRAAHDEVSAQRVLDNRIYQAFSNTLARSHAYAAMERVYETMHDSRYDLVVIDTPPAQSSVEILDAPDRLVPAGLWGRFRASTSDIGAAAASHGRRRIARLCAHRVSHRDVLYA
jgi:anion-transporting  ArsA/GET3 family ATPase